MINKEKQKRRLKKHLKRMSKDRLDKAWMQIFINARILKD